MRSLTVMSLVAATVATVTLTTASPAAAATVPSGFTDTSVGSVSSPTGLASLPDGTVLVLSQGGAVRVIRNNAVQASPALTLNLGGCDDSERGLLGVAVDPSFLVNRRVYLYYTRSAPGLPGGCVNRVSRFTMPSSTSISAASEVVLLDNISSVNGNHNGGDLEVGPDGYLYVSVGDAGSDPRGNSGSGGNNDAAQDLSLLNGKILRVDPTTGEAAPGNPLTGAGTASCRVRGNTSNTPTTSCREIYSWGLRNPFRIAFDPNTGPARFFINDVGQSTQEEVNLGGIGLNYGWNTREGNCPRGQNPPCAGPPAGLTDPITSYPRSRGTFITAGAFIPNGVWAPSYDGGYLFADGGSGRIWLRQANGAVNYDQPFATNAFGIVDMAFVAENGTYSLYYTVGGGSVRKIVGPGVSAPAPTALAFRSVPPGTRVLDTRLPAQGNTPVRANTTRYVTVSGATGATRAALVNIAVVQPISTSFVTAWAGRTARPLASNVNAFAGEFVANAAIVPVDADGGILVYANTTAHVVIDVLGFFDTAPGAVAAGRFVPLTPARIVDTRDPVSSSNEFTRVAGPPLPSVRVPVLDRAGMPATGVSAAVLTVTAVTAPSAGAGYLSASPAGAGFSGSSNLNTNGAGDIRPNLIVVPVGVDGSIDLFSLQVADVVVDVAGYFTDATAAAATAGRFVQNAPLRIVDTREALGFTRLSAGSAATIDPSNAPANAAALAHNITLVDNSNAGFITPYPATPPGPAPFVSAGNASGPAQIRAVLSFTKLGASAPASMNYLSSMSTDLVVDTPGYFEGG